MYPVFLSERLKQHLCEGRLKHEGKYQKSIKRDKSLCKKHCYNAALAVVMSALLVVSIIKLNVVLADEEKTGSIIAKKIQIQATYYKQETEDK